MKTMDIVCVIGLGEVGLPTASYISKFLDVIGYDINAEAVGRASSHGIFTTGNSIPRSDVYVLTVSTGNKKGEPDALALYDVCNKLSIFGSDFLVCVESTVPVGTCRKLAEKYGFKYLVNCPHRFWREDKSKHGISQPRVLGAINDESLEMGLRFYKSIDVPVQPVSLIEVSELSKLVENSHRYVQIALAEELKLLCDRMDLNFQELREACNTKWNVELLEARDGIGGHCLPKDILSLTLLGSSSPSIFREAIKVDEMYRKWLGGEK